MGIHYYIIPMSKESNHLFYVIFSSIKILMHYYIRFEQTSFKLMTRTDDVCLKKPNLIKRTV